MQGLDALEQREMVDHRHAVQVVDLVLEADGEEVVLGLILKKVAVEIRRVDDDVTRALDVH